MFNLKKVIASICVIAMMLTTVAFGATYSDVAEDSAYYEAVETLNKLDIVTGYEDGTYKPEDSVTRAEMAALIARIQGFGETAKGSAVTDFTDVPASHWASGYIANAAGMGIINGKGNGIFDPEAPVLYEEAVKMIMATLGYTPYANENGGYPAGYLAAAQRYDVSLLVSNATAGTEANRGTVAQLLANAIDTPLMAQVRWSTDGSVDYVICDGKTEGYDYKTLMSENLGYVKLRGIVAENIYTDLDDTKTLALDEEATVIIDVKDNFDTNNKDFENVEGKEVELLAADTDVADYLGQSVIVYVKGVKGEKYEVVSVAVDTARNDVLTMDLSQFKNYDAANGKINYYKTLTAKTSTPVNFAGEVVYNNVGGQDIADVLGDYVAENGASKFGGMITLIDNNDKSGYDVAIVEVATTVVVDEIGDELVTLKDSVAGADDFEIDELDVEAEDDRIVVISKDGEVIDYTELAEWDVLSVIAAGGSNADYILAEVVTNSIVGSVSSKFASARSFDGFGYTVEDANYDVAEGAYGIGDLEVGAGGTFFIDKYGKIAAFNEDAALATGVAATYGYINIAKAMDDELTGELTMALQMVTADGVETLEIKKNAKLNGGAMANPELLEDGAYNGIQLEGEVVKYTKNAAGLVTVITKADANDKFVSVAAAGEYAYDAENSRFTATGEKKYVEEDTIVFAINDTIKESYVGTVADLEDEVEYDILAMYANDKAENIVVVIDSTSLAISPKAGLAVVTKAGTASTDDGSVYAWSFILNGEEVDALSITDLWGDCEDITKGDVVKVNINSNGQVAAIEEIVDYATKAVVAANDGNEAFDGGVVDNFKKSASLVAFGSNEYKLTQAKNVYVIEAGRAGIAVETGSVANFKVYADLYDDEVENVEVYVDGEYVETVSVEDARADYADYIFVRTYEDKVEEVIIVKGAADVKIKAAN